MRNSDLQTLTVDIRELASRMTLKVILRGEEWTRRAWIAERLIRFAAWLAWMKAEMEIRPNGGDPIDELIQTLTTTKYSLTLSREEIGLLHSALEFLSKNAAPWDDEDQRRYRKLRDRLEALKSYIKDSWD